MSGIAWLDGKAGAFAGFDTETTSVDMETARIITATFHAYGCEPMDWLINPGVPIPAEATAVNGLTDEVAAQGVQPAEALHQIHGAIQDLWEGGHPLIGHNIRFDLTIFDRELRRHLGFPLEVNGPVIDSLVLDKAVEPYRKGSRKLADVARHWDVQVIEEDLHTSRGDVRIAVQTALAILRDGSAPYNAHGEVLLARLGLRDLHWLQIEAYEEQRTSFNSWLRGQGRVPDDKNTVWPLKPYVDGKVE